ncbi:MAG TPA: DedA family protein [Anaerolineae bacterium]|nr:DedA family protein [Anaerolineae bacterium]
MEALEHQVVLFLQNLIQSVGWAGIVLAMAIESACVPLPSEVTMPLAGWMLIQARSLSVWHTFWGGWWGAVGCTLGSVITYWVGAKGGRPLLERYGKYVLIRPHEIEVADRWFSKYGEHTAFFSRLMPVVRTFISLPAGVARMHFVKFVVWTFVGSFIWCWVLTWAGYVFGDHWERVREVMRPFDIPIVIAVCAFGGLFIYRRLKSRRAESGASAEEASE